MSKIPLFEQLVRLVGKQQVGGETASKVGGSPQYIHFLILRTL